MDTRKLSATVLAGLLLIGAPLSAEQPVAAEAARALSRLQGDIRHLASEELRGRSVADDTIRQAADFIANRMTSIGLDTNVFDQSPLQELEVQLGARAGEAGNNRVVFSIPGQTQASTAELDEGMNPMAIGSSSGHVHGKVVFAGYGITAPKQGYDDYQGIDASGAIVIVIRKEPGVNDPTSPFDGKRNTHHAFFATKIKNAIAHGAAALIIVNDAASVLESVQNERSKVRREQQRKEAVEQKIEQLPAEAKNNRRTFRQTINGIEAMLGSMRADLVRAERGLLGVGAAGNRSPNSDSIPVVSVARDVVDQWLQESLDQSLESVEQSIDKTMKPKSSVLANATIDLQVELKPSAAETSNVIGVLAGKGELADQTIVVGAHYDHVGMGGYGSLAPGTVAVHNGADDNASGTATMLSVAENLVERLRDEASHRRVVFIAFTGEERGLIGSKYYIRHPRYPLDSTVAMLNLDMVGRLSDNELTVFGTGSATAFDAMIDEANERHQFKLMKVPTGYGPSDHQSFYEAGIPVLFFFTGLHNDYHRPTDDFDKIDFGGMVRITDIVSDVAFRLASQKDRPEYAETENRVSIPRQKTAFIGVSLSDRDGHVVLSGLTPDGPAERGGMRIGDRLEQLGKRRIQTAADVLEWMRRRSPGEEAQIQVIRDGEKIDISLRMDSRPDG